ncbi:MAG: RagB/SusD family nutrient uptake outer membrane protein [Bacteroidales bacterium]|jgi:hypothetical protein|nr:RagB/SusD family nutrient uptake outer membrane protein [Bacteroidales bacterium]
MKKYLIKISALVLGLTLTFACNEDLLEIPEKGVLDFNKYYTNAGPAEAESLIASIYDQHYGMIEGIATQIFLDVLSDDHFAGGNSFGDGASGFNMAANLNMSSSSHTNPNTMYTNAYKIINWANNIIELIPETSDERVNRVKAEANFFRALMMFELVRWFGTPPFVDRLTEEQYPENGDHYEIITWCLERMQEAADALPAIQGMGQQRAFNARISKHAALAYKGKIALWYGTRYNNNEILAQAVEPLKTVINSGLYGLVDDMFTLGRPAADFSKEYIWEHNAADAGGYANNQSDIRHIWTNWRPENMILPDNLYNLGWQWDPPSGNFGDFMKEYHGGDIENHRFKSTLHTYDQIMEMSYTRTVNPPGIFVPLSASQGYFRYRGLLFVDDIYAELPGQQKKSKGNTYFMRYSEVLLMYAEAKFLTDDADGTGLQALNEVRRRAQIPELDVLTYEDIKDERRAELWAEGERYFDLVRWGDAATVLKNKGQIRYTFYGYKEGTKEWDIRESTPTAGTANGWDKKFELFPFPYAQTSANPNLTQNPGW